MSERQLSQLPSGWLELAVADIAERIEYGHTAAAKLSGDGPRFLRITDIQDGDVDWSQVPVCDIEREDLAKYLLQAGDIVFARTGATTGKSYVIRECAAPTVFASYLIRLRLRAGIQPLLVWYFFQTSRYWRQIEGKAAGIAQPGVNATKLATLRLPIPPLAEQTRIVEAVETQLTRLDAAVAALERVRANLKRYRASVLKAAVEGRLVPTEAELARREGRDYEPASVLLQRILAERRRKCEAGQLAAVQAKGKAPRGEKWKAKYIEPVPPITAGLTELPEGWCWASLDQLAYEIRNGYSKGVDFHEQGPP